jgi:hypothetical protein
MGIPADDMAVMHHSSLPVAPVRRFATASRPLPSVAVPAPYAREELGRSLGPAGDREQDAYPGFEPFPSRTGSRRRSL